MVELAHFVVRAERDGRQDRVVKVDERSHPEAQVWLWRHKALFLVAGVLALLVIGVNAI
jgi:hypothetical protein